jgi:hypothetical protein
MKPNGYGRRIAAKYFLLCVVIVLFATGCSKKYTLLEPSAFESLKPFRAKVQRVTETKYSESVDLVVIFLKAENGERIAFGGTNQTVELKKFGETLKEQTTYDFPKVWLDFKEARH